MADTDDMIVIVGNKISDAKARGKAYCITCQKEVWSLYTHQHCPKCGAGPEDQEIRNYNMMWHDGDIHCIKCGTYVRDYDAG